MDQKTREKLQNIVEKTKNDDICKEKPSFASVVFAYKVLQEGIGKFLEHNVSAENTEHFLNEIAPISRVNQVLLNLGIIQDFDERFPYWINYVGDLIVAEFIEEAKMELEWIKNNPIQ